MNGSILLEIFAPAKSADQIWRQLAPLTENDWEALLLQAWLHKIIPLMWQKLKSLGLSESLPQSARHIILAQVQVTAEHNFVHYRELVQLLAQLEGQGIEVILLKGIHLAQTVYRDLSLRPMGDMDILVRQEHLAATKAILLDQGYVQKAQLSIEESCAYSHHLPTFYKSGNINIAIEVHWRITRVNSHFDIDLDALWQRALWWQLGQYKIGGLSIEDLLLHLALHTAYQDLFKKGIIALFDIAKTIEHYGTVLDWDILQKRAREWDATRPLFLTLYLAQELVGAKVPATLLQSLTPDDYQKWVEFAKCRLIAEYYSNEKIPDIDNWASVLNKVQKREKGTTPLQFIIKRLLFPARQQLMYSCPWLKSSSLAYLCLPVLWLSFLKRYGWGLLQFIFKSKKRQEANTKLQQLEPSVQLYRWFTNT